MDIDAILSKQIDIWMISTLYYLYLVFVILILIRKYKSPNSLQELLCHFFILFEVFLYTLYQTDLQKAM